MNKYANSLAKDKHVVTYQNFCEFPVNQTRPIAKSRVLQAISDGPTDQRTDRPINGWTDKTAYRVASTRLKNTPSQGNNFVNV